MSNLHFAVAFTAMIATGLGGAFLVGIWWERQSQLIHDLEDYKEGTEDAQDATADLPDDDAGNIGWLREYLGR